MVEQNINVNPGRNSRERAFFDTYEKYANGTDKILQVLARETIDILTKEGIGLCFRNAAAIARQIVNKCNKGELTGTSHIWYGCPYPKTPGHATYVFKTKEQLYLLDTVGFKPFKMVPESIIIKKNQYHPIYANPQIEQMISPSLEIGDYTLIEGMPSGEELPFTMDSLFPYTPIKDRFSIFFNQIKIEPTSLQEIIA